MKTGRHLRTRGAYHRSCAAPLRTHDAAQCQKTAEMLRGRRRCFSFHPTTVAGFLFLFFVAVFEAPCLPSMSTTGNRVSANLCETGDSSSATFGRVRNLVVTPETSGTATDGDIDLTTIFDCEDGEFNVSWSGVVNVASTITIGKGTTVTIVGDMTNVGSGRTSSMSSSVSTSAVVGGRQHNYTAGFQSERIDSDAFGPIFDVNDGQLILEGISIRDGSTDSVDNSLFGGGGGIHAINSNVTVTSCEFENNLADSLGGGIYVNGSTLKVVDSFFLGNQAGFDSGQGNDDSIGAGGAIWAQHTDIVIDSCTFEGNYASYSGGGMHQDIGHASINNSYFLNNLAGNTDTQDRGPGGEGGGISFGACDTSFDGLRPCGVFNTNMTGNKSGKLGGAVLIGSSRVGSSFEFRSCVIDDNMAKGGTQKDIEGKGGAVSMGTGTHLTLTDCFVTNNTAAEAGGAVVMESTDFGDNPGASIVLRNCYFCSNIAEAGDGGVINAGNYSTVHITERSIFTQNEAVANGAVLAAMSNTNLIVEGGEFSGNVAQEGGGVFWIQGSTLDITGGAFINNSAEGDGGVIHASDASLVTFGDGIFRYNEANNGAVVSLETSAEAMLQGCICSDNVAVAGGGVLFLGEGTTVEMRAVLGTAEQPNFDVVTFSDNSSSASHSGIVDYVTSVVFETNTAKDGGAVYISSDATLLIVDCWFSGHVANDKGGAIYVEADGAFEIIGGIFSENESDLGGFVFKRGAGNASCTGASILGNSAVNGGAVYALDGSFLEWDCDLGKNVALAGPAIYARGDSTVIIRDVKIFDNEVLGSVVLLIMSHLSTYGVVFSDTSGSSDLSAVQLAHSSVYMAEDTTFEGFEGEAIIFSEGRLLYLDDCDFSRSSAPTLVISDSENSTVIRNAVLGDSNYKALRTAASDSRNLPTAESFVNVNITCGLGRDLCSEGSVCLDGDLGIYCQCYVRESTGDEKCLDGDSSTLSLAVGGGSNTTFFPDLVETDLNLAVATNDQTVSSVPVGVRGDVVWNLSAALSEDLTWTVFPSVGLLRSGDSIVVRVVGVPSEMLDGTTTATFHGDGMGVLENDQAAVVQVDQQGAHMLDKSFDVTFYRCEAGKFWDGSTCQFCTEAAGADIEGLDCSEPGASARTLPVRSGYWRETLTSTFVRKCWNEDACKGGFDVVSIEEYCTEGYKGPYCAVCATGFGRGVANACHRCTNGFKSVMYFFVAVGTLIMIVVAAIVAVYLVGGKGAVSSTINTTRESIRTLQRRVQGITVSSSNGNRSSGCKGLRRMWKKLVKVTGEKKSLIHLSTKSDVIGPPQARPNRRGDGRENGEDGEGGDCDNTAGGLESSAPPGPRRGGLAPGGTTVGVGGGLGSRGGDGKPKKKTAAARVGEMFSSLPLSKLKVVIVVWQISSAVTFPPAFEKFLSFIGVFSFDLSWILSAACLTIGLDFYDQLLLVTIGPMVLLCLLGVTFFIGSRPKASSQPYKHSLTRSLTGASYGARDGSLSSSAISLGAQRAVGNNAAGEATKAPSSFFAFSRGASKKAELIRAESPPMSPGPNTRGLGRSQRSVRSVAHAGPGDNVNSDQSELWSLFSRHTTILLIILYLIYSQVSTVVFQTFSCDDLKDVGKSYLRADLSITCNTPRHNGFKIYAAFMIILYPLGIPAAFCYFLVRQASRINPPTDMALKDLRGRRHIVHEKIAQRKGDRSLAPTSFLWNAYVPDRYYYEVCECARRLLLTGLLVFVVPDTSGQVAFSCIIAFLSLLVFELLRPHVDPLDVQLYRTGCVVIFFTNFLALLIKAGVTNASSKESEVYAVALIVVNILFFLSIWWNTWAVVKATFNRRHVQDVMIGVDFVGEKKMDRWLGSMKSDRPKHAVAEPGEVKTENVEAAPAWERDLSVVGDGNDSSIDLTGHHAKDVDAHSVATTAQMPSTLFWFSKPTANITDDWSVSSSGKQGVDSSTGSFPGTGGVDDSSVDATLAAWCKRGVNLPSATSSRGFEGDEFPTATPQQHGRKFSSVDSRGTVLSSCGGDSGTLCCSPAGVAEFGGRGEGMFVREPSVSVASHRERASRNTSRPDRGDARTRDDSATDRDPSVSVASTGKRDSRGISPSDRGEACMRDNDSIMETSPSGAIAESGSNSRNPSWKGARARPPGPAVTRGEKLVVVIARDAALPTQGN